MIILIQKKIFRLLTIYPGYIYILMKDEILVKKWFYTDGNVVV